MISIDTDIFITSITSLTLFHYYFTPIFHFHIFIFFITPILLRFHFISYFISSPSYFLRMQLGRHIIFLRWYFRLRCCFVRFLHRFYFLHIFISSFSFLFRACQSFFATYFFQLRLSRRVSATVSSQDFAHRFLLDFSFITIDFHSSCSADFIFNIFRCWHRKEFSSSSHFQW